MNCSSMENVLGKMNKPSGATFEAFGAETVGEKRAVHRSIYNALIKRWAGWEPGGRYKLTNKGRLKLYEIVSVNWVKS